MVHITHFFLLTGSGLPGAHRCLPRIHLPLAALEPLVPQVQAPLLVSEPLAVPLRLLGMPLLDCVRHDGGQ